MKIYLAYARVCYSLVVVVAAITASYFAVLAVKGMATWSAPNWLLTAAFSLAFLFLCGKAVVRKLRGRFLLSQPIDDKRVVYFFFMTLLGSIGHFFTSVVCNAYYIVITQVRDMPAPVAIAGVFAGACYLMALWIGEFAIIQKAIYVTTEPPKVGSNERQTLR